MHYAQLHIESKRTPRTKRDPEGQPLVTRIEFVAYLVKEKGYRANVTELLGQTFVSPERGLDVVYWLRGGFRALCLELPEGAIADRLTLKILGQAEIHARTDGYVLDVTVAGKHVAELGRLLKRHVDAGDVRVLTSPEADAAEAEAEREAAEAEELEDPTNPEGADADPAPAPDEDASAAPKRRRKTPKE